MAGLLSVDRQGLCERAREGRAAGAITRHSLSCVAVLCAAAPADKNEPGAIRIDGVMQLCEDLGVAPDDVVTIVLAWKFNAAESGMFLEKEFVEGMAEVGYAPHMGMGAGTDARARAAHTHAHANRRGQQNCPTLSLPRVTRPTPPLLSL